MGLSTVRVSRTGTAGLWCGSGVKRLRDLVSTGGCCFECRGGQEAGYRPVKGVGDGLKSNPQACRIPALITGRFQLHLLVTLFLETRVYGGPHLAAEGLELLDGI